MTHSEYSATGNRLVVFAIVAIVAIYAGAASMQWPQKGTEIVKAHAAHSEHDSHHDDDKQVEPGAHDEQDEDQHDHDDTHTEDDDHAQPTTITPPPAWTVIPFGLLLGCIAVLPLIRTTEHWWESNSNRLLVAVGLGLATLAYYAFMHPHAIDAHWPAHTVVQPVDSGVQWHFAWTVLANAILHEYIPFIVLLFSLYVISGGIRISGDLAAHPLTNTAFIAVGGALASFIGTTGAAMLLIRPLLETNAERKHVRHTVILFIFVVCNCGGLLLPIGDPPLFLGYLRGVPFMWTMSLIGPWLFVNSMLLAIYWAMDHFFYYPHETKSDVQRDETRTTGLRIQGLLLHGPLLLGVVLAVAFLDPSKAIPGTDFHAWLYLREIVQIGLVGIALMFGSLEVRRANKFSFHAIIEVAALFLGIFICMQPALQILGVEGKNLGIDTPQMFFWITGGLSSVLDNAPTYVVFFETAKTLPTAEGAVTVAGVYEPFLKAISLGAVFMGAMTYIGNGPNFMVKAIAESSGVRMPSFFGYVIYSGLILLPVLVVTTLIFL
jgi:Na+/H+ antiporter NhaD/arsenite permease-like protein